MNLKTLLSSGAITLSAALLACPMNAAFAQSIPKGSIRFIVSLPPGGSVDNVAREIGQKLSESIGQPVVIENRPGASNIIGASMAASAPPDGQTIYMGVSGLTTLASLHRKLPFNLERDFAPVSLVARMPFVFVVPATLPAKSIKELIEFAKSRPGQLNYGSYGNGTAPHLSAIRLAQMAGIEMVHVPYKGSVQALTDLVAGQISLMIADIGPAMPLVQSGKLRALAVSTAQRTALAPTLLTMAEAGVPGYESSGWFGVLAPAALPRDIVSRYNTEISKIMQMAEVKSRMALLGMEISTSSPEEFAQLIKADIARNAELIKLSGIRMAD